MGNIAARGRSLPVADRIRLVQEVWDGLADHEAASELTDSQKTELDRRLAENDAAPEDVVPWEEVKALARLRP